MRGDKFRDGDFYGEKKRNQYEAFAQANPGAEHSGNTSPNDEQNDRQRIHRIRTRICSGLLIVPRTGMRSVCFPVGENPGSCPRPGLSTEFLCIDFAVVQHTDGRFQLHIVLQRSRYASVLTF